MNRGETLSPKRRLAMGITGLVAFITSYTITYDSVDQHQFDAPPAVLVLEAAELIGMAASSTVVLNSISDIAHNN